MPISQDVLRLVGWAKALTCLSLLFCGVSCATTTRRSSATEVQRAPAAWVEKLTSDIRGLDRTIDPHEARELADIAINHSLDLADSYHVVRPAFLHNVLVNTGLRDRGLCYHWADDLHTRLLRLSRTSLDIHRVVARLNTSHEHNALVATAKGQGYQTGLVLDAWREGGRLFWKPVVDDKKFPWIIRP